MFHVIPAITVRDAIKYGCPHCGYAQKLHTGTDRGLRPSTWRCGNQSCGRDFHVYYGRPSALIGIVKPHPKCPQARNPKPRRTKSRFGALGKYNDFVDDLFW